MSLSNIAPKTDPNANFNLLFYLNALNYTTPSSLWTIQDVAVSVRHNPIDKPQPQRTKIFKRFFDSPSIEPSITTIIPYIHAVTCDILFLFLI